MLSEWGFTWETRDEPQARSGALYLERHYLLDTWPRGSRANRSLCPSCGPCKSRSICTTSHPPYRTGIDKTQDRKHFLVQCPLLLLHWADWTAALLRCCTAAELCAVKYREMVHAMAVPSTPGSRSRCEDPSWPGPWGQASTSVTLEAEGYSSPWSNSQPAKHPKYHTALAHGRDESCLIGSCFSDLDIQVTQQTDNNEMAQRFWLGWGGVATSRCG